MIIAVASKRKFVIFFFWFPTSFVFRPILFAAMWCRDSLPVVAQTSSNQCFSFALTSLVFLVFLFVFVFAGGGQTSSNWCFSFVFWPILFAAMWCNVMQGQFAGGGANIINIQGGREWPTLLKSLSEYWPNIDTQSHVENTQSHLRRECTIAYT